MMDNDRNETGMIRIVARPVPSFGFLFVCGQVEKHKNKPNWWLTGTFGKTK